MEEKATTTQITVFLYEKPVQVEISKYTTCDDVIEMVLYSTTEKSQSNKYGLFESAHGVEKLAAGKSMISKNLRSHGVNRDMSFHVRKLEKIKGKLPSLSKAKRKMTELLAIKSKKTTGKITNNNTLQNNLACEAPDSKDNLYQKSKELPRPHTLVDSLTRGKVALMSRFLDDVTGHAVTDNDVPSLYADGRNGQEVEDLDTAFVEEEVVDDLNECVIYEESSDGESAFHDSWSECSDESTGRRKCANIINILEKVGDRNDSPDDVLESFMKTLVHNMSRHEDEGMSSMESGDGLSTAES